MAIAGVGRKSTGKLTIDHGHKYGSSIPYSWHQGTSIDTDDVWLKLDRSGPFSTYFLA